MKERRVISAAVGSRAELLGVLEGVLAGKPVLLALASTPSGEQLVELRAATVGWSTRLTITIVARDGERWRVRLEPTGADQRQQLVAQLAAQQAAAARGDP